MRDHPGTFTAGLVFAIFGLLYLLDALDVWDMRPIRLWPILLIAVGFSILIGTRTGDRED